MRTAALIAIAILTLPALALAVGLMALGDLVAGDGWLEREE
jgi:hypothetical protein